MTPTHSSPLPALLCLLLLCAVQTAGAQENTWKELSPQEVHQMISDGADMVLVNTMSFLEYRDHTIGGSVCLPAPYFAEMAFKVLPNKDQLIIFYCESASCKRSYRAGQSALEMGYTNVAILAGGMPAWKQEGFEIISTIRIPRKGIRSVKPRLLKSRLDNKEAMIIVDIRSPRDFEEVSIPGALNIPMDELDKRYQEIAWDNAIVVVDENGYRSFLAACYLSWKGHGRVERLFGGMQDWKKSFSDIKNDYDYN